MGKVIVSAGVSADGFYEVHAVLPLGLTEREGAR